MQWAWLHSSFEVTLCKFQYANIKLLNFPTPVYVRKKWETSWFSSQIQWDFFFFCLLMLFTSRKNSLWGNQIVTGKCVHKTTRVISALGWVSSVQTWVILRHRSISLGIWCRGRRWQREAWHLSSDLSIKSRWKENFKTSF